MFDFIRDCHTATLHLEQARGQRLAWPSRLRLGLHLAYCPLCRCYARQSCLLEKLAQPLPFREATLSWQARQRLQELLHRAGY